MQLKGEVKKWLQRFGSPDLRLPLSGSSRTEQRPLKLVFVAPTHNLCRLVREHFLEMDYAKVYPDLVVRTPQDTLRFVSATNRQTNVFGK